MTTRETLYSKLFLKSIAVPPALLLLPASMTWNPQPERMKVSSVCFRCVSQVRLFADDCLLYTKINSFQDHIKLQNDLKSLEVWATTWGMRFNAAKCYILSIRSTSTYMYSLNNTILKSVPNNPYLGVLLSNDLQWSDHICKITKKANSALGFLRRNLRKCPPKCRLNAYLSLVRSTLEYGSIIWDPHLKKDIDALERIQRAAARFITGDYKTRTPGSIQHMMTKLELTSLQVRRKQLRLTFLYKVIEGLVPAIPPDSYLKPQKPGRQIRTRSRQNFIVKNAVEDYVRNNDRCFIIPASKTVQYKNSFFPKTIVDWNHLPNDTVHTKTIDSFRNRIRKECQSTIPPPSSTPATLDSTTDTSSDSDSENS